MGSAQNKKRLGAFPRLLILSFSLMLISLISIGLLGKSCSLNFDLNSTENLIIEYDESIVECTEQNIDGNVLNMDFRSVSKGVSFVEVSEDNGESYSVRALYVHSFGIITIDNYFGRCRGDILFPVSFILILIMILNNFLRRYRENTQTTLCRYSNAWLLGTIVFILFLLTNQILNIVYQNSHDMNPSVLNLLEGSINSAQLFTILLLPVSIIVSLTISISNLFLLKNEGICLKNMLGFLLGIFLCIGTIVPNLVYPFLEYTGAEVHRYSSFFVLIENCLEDIIAIIMAYLECVLLGTALSALRAAKHVPEFNKDFILILGCQITKDGGLTKLLQSRTDKAIKFAEMQKKATGKDLVFVPSGGQGSDEIISEGEAIHNYLVSKGIAEDRILVENRSTNTDQNIRFSYDLIKERKEEPNIAFSTTNYHVFRAGCIADELGIPIEGIGARTKSYFWINAFIREFIATLHYEKGNHIKSLFLILITVLPIEAIIFISYLM
ncbi:MAG: YdcF family protein [Ruminococcus sp.]|nr:YdcF family protein [Ruminococcus sp.]